MIEGRSGGSGRGTRRELWAHLAAVLQPADRTLYRVPTLDPRRPLISFPPPLPHPRTCLLVTGKNSAAPERTFSSLVSAVFPYTTLFRSREERGIWAGHSKRIVGPPDSGSSTSGAYVVSCTDGGPSPPTHFLPSAASSPSHLPAGHGKNSAAPARTLRSAPVAAAWRGPKA